MLNPSAFVNSVFQQLQDKLPKGSDSLRQDFEHNLRLSLQAAFNKLDLVSREEFDVQTAILEKTRARVAALEARIDALEQTQTLKTKD